MADWKEFQSRFGGSLLRRVWLSGRLLTLLKLTATTGKLQRVFIWGSFVTAKPAPRDLDILPIMDQDFEVDGVGAAAQDVFDSMRAKLLFQSDVRGRTTLEWRSRCCSKFSKAIRRSSST